MELTSYVSVKPEEAAKDESMTKWIGMDSHHKTAQMEKNESEESCMAEKNHRVSEA